MITFRRVHAGRPFNSLSLRLPLDALSSSTFPLLIDALDRPDPSSRNELDICGRRSLDLTRLLHRGFGRLSRLSWPVSRFGGLTKFRLGAWFLLGLRCWRDNRSRGWFSFFLVNFDLTRLIQKVPIAFIVTYVTCYLGKPFNFIDTAKLFAYMETFKNILKLL